MKKKNWRLRVILILAMFNLAGIISTIAATGIARITILGEGSLHFGDVLIGSFVDRLITLRNDGSLELNGTITGLEAPFRFISGESPLNVKPGATYALTVRCAPTNVGTFRITLRINTNDPTTPEKNISLMCNGIGPEINVLSGETVNFGEVEVGRFVERDIIIRNNGTEGLKGVIYAPATPFSLSRGEGAFDVSAGRTYTVTVRCSPSNRGTFMGTIEMKDVNDANDPSKTILLFCTGVGPEITLFTEGQNDTGLGSGPHLTLNFGETAVRQAVDITFEIRNDGERPLRGTVNTPTPAPPFSLISGGGAFTLDPTKTRLVTVRCQRNSQQDFAGTLTISNLNDTDETTKTVALTCGRAMPDIDVTPMRLDFGSITQKALGQNNVIVGNSGPAPLKLNSVLITANPAVFTVLLPTGCRRFPCTLLPGESLSFTVKATPNRQGLIIGNLRIISDDPDEKILNIPLQVNGVKPASSSESLDTTDLQIRQTKNVLEFQAPGLVKVGLYDSSGRKIAEAIPENNQLHIVTFNYEGKHLANGVYFYIVTYTKPDGSLARSRLQKLVLLR